MIEPRVMTEARILADYRRGFLSRGCFPVLLKHMKPASPEIQARYGSFKRPAATASGDRPRE